MKSDWGGEKMSDGGGCKPLHSAVTQNELGTSVVLICVWNLPSLKHIFKKHKQDVECF